MKILALAASILEVRYFCNFSLYNGEEKWQEILPVLFLLKRTEIKQKIIEYQRRVEEVEEEKNVLDLRKMMELFWI